MNGNLAAKQINKLIFDENIKRKREFPHSNFEDIKLNCNIVACTANTTKYWDNLARTSGMLYVMHKPM